MLCPLRLNSLGTSPVRFQTQKDMTEDTWSRVFNGNDWKMVEGGGGFLILQSCNAHNHTTNPFIQNINTLIIIYMTTHTGRTTHNLLVDHTPNPYIYRTYTHNLLFDHTQSSFTTF
jgi:hypothetical protein